MDKNKPSIDVYVNPQKLKTQKLNNAEDRQSSRRSSKLFTTDRLLRLDQVKNRVAQPLNTPQNKNRSYSNSNAKSGQYLPEDYSYEQEGHIKNDFNPDTQNNRMYEPAINYMASPKNTTLQKNVNIPSPSPRPVYNKLTEGQDDYRDLEPYHRQIHSHAKDVKNLRNKYESMVDEEDYLISEESKMRLHKLQETEMSIARASQFLEPSVVEKLKSMVRGEKENFFRYKNEEESYNNFEVFQKCFVDNPNYNSNSSRGNYGRRGYQVSTNQGFRDANDHYIHHQQYHHKNNDPAYHDNYYQENIPLHDETYLDEEQMSFGQSYNPKLQSNYYDYSQNNSYTPIKYGPFDRPKKPVQLIYDKNGTPSPKKIQNNTSENDQTQENDLMSLSEAFDFFKNGLKSRMDLRRRMISKDDIKELEDNLIQNITDRIEEQNENPKYLNSKKKKVIKTPNSRTPTRQSVNKKSITTSKRPREVTNVIKKDSKQDTISARKQKVKKMKNLSRENQNMNSTLNQDTWGHLEEKMMTSRSDLYNEMIQNGVYPSDHNTKKNVGRRGQSKNSNQKGRSRDKSTNGQSNTRNNTPKPKRNNDASYKNQHNSTLYTMYNNNQMSSDQNYDQFESHMTDKYSEEDQDQYDQSNQHKELQKTAKKRIVSKDSSNSLMMKTYDDCNITRDRSRTLERLHEGIKPSVSQKEMKERSQKYYERLAEVQLQKKKQYMKEQKIQNMKRKKDYEQVSILVAINYCRCLF